MTDSFLRQLNEEVNFFVEERDWDVFQTPKNLSMALIVEAAELVEHFQWMRPEESDSLTNDKKTKVAEELADILIYTVRLADRLGLDLEQSAKDKLTKHAPFLLVANSFLKYPPIIESTFERWDTLSENKKFSVYLARR